MDHDILELLESLSADDGKSPKHAKQKASEKDADISSDISSGISSGIRYDKSSDFEKSNQHPINICEQKTEGLVLDDVPADASVTPALVELQVEDIGLIPRSKYKRLVKKHRRFWIVAGVAIAILPIVASAILASVYREEVNEFLVSYINKPQSDMAIQTIQNTDKNPDKNTSDTSSVSSVSLANQSGKADVFEYSGLNYEKSIDFGGDVFGYHPVLMVENKAIVILDSFADYDWLSNELMAPYSVPIAGGKPWKRGFANNVEVYYQSNDAGIMTKEEAYEIMKPFVSVRFREKLYSEKEIKFETEKLEDPSIATGEILIATEGKNGLREEVYEIVSVDAKETERNLLGTRVLQAPITRIEITGTGAVKNITENQSPSALPSISPSVSPSVSLSISPSISPKATPKSTPEINTASVLIPEEVTSNDVEHKEPEIKPEKTSDIPKRITPANAPSSGFSSFNYPMPATAWYSNSEIGAGENYPGIDKEADSASHKNQGISGPSAPISLAKPLSSSISSYFGWRQKYERVHYGLDYSASKGTPILASGAGIATWYTNAEGNASFGKVVELNHGGGFTTLYAHCDSINVKEGDYVERGDVIGYVGDTASAGYVHLHFEIRHNGIPYNPYLGYF